MTETSPTLWSLPPKAHAIMQEQLQDSAAFFRRLVETTLKEAEDNLFEKASRARDNAEQQKNMAAVAEIKRHADQVVAAALAPLATRLQPFGQPILSSKPARQQVSLSLLSKQSQDESVILEDLAARAEARTTLILFELGHRYAALVGSPVFENNAHPFSPLVFCEYLRQAMQPLQLLPEHKVILYQLFSHQYLLDAYDFYNKLNTHLSDHGILPNLRIFALRKREQGSTRTRSHQSPAPLENHQNHPSETTSEATLQSDTAIPFAAPSVTLPAAAPQPTPSTTAAATTTAVNASATPAAQTSAPDLDKDRYHTLSQLLNEQRSQTASAPADQTHLIDPQQLNTVFAALQQIPATVQAADGELAPRNIHQLRQDMMEQLQQTCPDGALPAFTPAQTNAIDLMTMLFDRLSTSIRSNSGNYLLSELQAPLLRMAMTDSSFFTQRSHPARNWLEKVALASSRWGADGDQSDHEVALITRIHSMNRTINREFNGDPAIFDGMAHDLQTQLEQLAHRANVAEKRSIEASQGRERLQLARKHAEELVKKRIAQWQGSALTQKILQHAWIDVITLCLLRNGDNSDALRHHLQLLDALASIKRTRMPGAQLIKFSKAIKEAFEQAGMDSLEAELLANEATGLSNAEEADKSQSMQQELIQKIEQRRDSDIDTVDNIIQSASLKTNSHELEEQINQIKDLSFGTWFEFDQDNEQHAVNRKLAWYSPRTGRCLFVNRHGIRTHETSIEHLAESMLANKVRLAPPEPQGSFIERALDSIISGLKRLSGTKTIQESPA